MFNPVLAKKIFNNLSWLFFEKAVRILGSLVVGIWVARYLGPENFGILNYSIAYVALFILFVRLGLDQIVVREIVKRPEETDVLLGTSFCLKLIGAFVALILIYISLIFIKTDNLVNFVIFILAAGFLFESLNVIDFFYRSQMLSKYVVISKNIAFIISCLLKIYFILKDYDVLFFAAANTIDILLGAFFIIIIYKLTKKDIRKWHFNYNIAKKLLIFSWPLAISSFLISAHMKIDQVMIGNMLDKSDVGIYSIAVRLAEFWYFIPMIIINSLIPYFIELREINPPKYKARLIQLYGLSFWIGIFAGIFFVLLGDQIISVLFGVTYIGAYKALVINIWAGVFVAQAFARGIWVISENMQIYRIVSNLVALLLNLSLNFLLIPMLGITGAAISTLITRFANCWLIPILIIKPYRANTVLSIKSINPFFMIKASKYV